MDVAGWLESLGLGEYAPAFAENRIGADVLPSLSDRDLRDLGIAALGDRKRLLAAIAALAPEDVAGGGDGGTGPAPFSGPAGEGERRQVTVLFADIAGYTALSERLGAEAVHGLLNRYFEAADRIVEEFGGNVDKHMGDNVMAVFGAPVAHDNDPERAVRAALAIHAAAAGIALPGGAPLALHIGIASGQVVASGTGSDSHRQYTVTGDSVNLAARLQALAGDGQTLVSEPVQRQTAGRFAAVALGPQGLKGIAQPVPVWRIDGVQEVPEAARGTPFVGRRAELGQCRAILDEVAETGAGQTVLLRGPAGIGKTRLSEEIARAARASGFTVHRCLVLDFGTRKGQRAIPALVRSLVGLPPSSTKEDRVRAADAAFAAGAFTADQRVVVNDLLDLPQPLELRALYDAMDETARRDGRRALVAGLAAWASRAAPRLILIEDLHWADAGTLQNLAAVVAVAREHPVVLLATTRPEGDPLEGAWRAVGLDHPVSTLNLGPLRASEARAMATGFARAGEDRLAECLKRAAGNPLFLEQLLQSVAESAEALVPGSIQSLVLARMDRLDLLDRHALQAASVCGQRFQPELLRYLIETPDYDCASLLKHQLVRPEGEDYLFAHALIRDGVYESILTAARARLHLKAAAWFADGDPALHAEHLGLAGDPRAPRAYMDAARAAMDSYRNAQAIALLHRGEELATTPGDRVALALLLGEVQRESGALDEARAAFGAALEAAGDDAARCRARLGLAGVKRITDDIDGAMADLDLALEAAERLGMTEAAARAHHLRGNLRFPRGDVEGCLAAHGTALRLAREAGSAELEAAALGGLADAEYMRGRFRTACARFRECVEISRANAFGRIEVANLPMLALTAMWGGEPELGTSAAFEAIAAARRVGHGRAEIIALHAVSHHFLSNGELAEARRHATRSGEIAVELGARRFQGEAMLFTAVIDHYMMNHESAAALMRAALAIHREAGMGFMGPMALGGLAMVTRDPAEREAALAEGEALLAGNGLAHNHMFYRQYAIEACLDAGKHDAAERHGLELTRLFTPDELPLAHHHGLRGMALARFGRGERTAELGETLDRLIAQGLRQGDRHATQALREARAAL